MPSPSTSTSPSLSPSPSPSPSSGPLALAQVHYERALEAFSSARAPSRLSYLVYGNVDHKRCEFVRERLADVALGRLPDLDKYLDGNGQRRAVTDSDRERTPRGPSTAPPPRIASYAAACPSAADQWLDSERSGAS